MNQNYLLVKTLLANRKLFRARGTELQARAGSKTGEMPV
jgi:hypothetical protein